MRIDRERYRQEVSHAVAAEPEEAHMVSIIPKVVLPTAQLSLPVVRCDGDDQNDDDQDDDDDDMDYDDDVVMMMVMRIMMMIMMMVMIYMYCAAKCTLYSYFRQESVG